MGLSRFATLATHMSRKLSLTLPTSPDGVSKDTKSPCGVFPTGVISFVLPDFPIVGVVGFFGLYFGLLRISQGY
jgi:hypothetical protein